MRRLTAGALTLFVIGIALLAYAAYLGDMTFTLVVIIPVVQSSSPWALAGMALIFVAIFLFFFSLATPMRETPSQQTATAPQSAAPQQPAKKFGGVVFIGPIPIVFGSDKRVAKWMIIVALVVVILSIVALWYFATNPPR
jgi:uncharacterized protein (TIGR00304 family)